MTKAGDRCLKLQIDPRDAANSFTGENHYWAEVAMPCGQWWVTGINERPRTVLEMGHGPSG